MPSNSRPSSGLSKRLRTGIPPSPRSGTVGTTGRNNTRPGLQSQARAVRKGTGRHGASRPAPAHSSTGSQPGSQYASQIGAESALRFGPQADALALLLRQAASDRDLGVAVQKSTAKGLVDLSSRAQPQIAAIESAGAQRVAAPYQQVQVDQAQLGPSADPIRAATARDYAMAAANQAADTQAMSVELKQRQLDALAGRQAGIMQVENQYATDKGKVADQLSSLAGQEGAFTSSRLAQLLGDVQKRSQQVSDQRRSQSFQRAQQQRQQTFQAGENQKSRAARSTVKQGGYIQTAQGPIKRATPQQHGQVRDRIDSVVAQIKPYTSSLPREKVAALFLYEAPEEKSPDGTVMPAIKAVPQQWLSLALDLAYDGHVSDRNAGTLHRRGLTVSGLGYPASPTRKGSGLGTPPTARLKHV